MKTISLHHLTLASLTSFGALAMAGGPAFAQQAPPKWVPTRESITISAAASKNYRVVLTGSHLGQALIVSASMAVPYSDLNLTRDPDAAELGRRIHVAARLVCNQLDLKYPPTQYPILDGFDCEHDAAVDGMSRADLVIASARK
ncbi:MAG TPA: UrcA family protein [Rhizomicrobium sp.]|jgi:UrcA family protein|nr:UrcA family protein [Rhizomicrobium sp.]